MNRALSALGIARRAGKLRWGFDTAVGAMRNGECRLLVAAADLSDKTKKNVLFEAERCGVPFVQSAFTMEEIKAGIGKHTGVLAVVDEGLASLVIRELGAAGEREELRI